MAPVLVACVAAAGGYMIGTAANSDFGDFRGTLWEPAQLIRAGLSPYPGAHNPMTGAVSVYPPPLILTAGVPLTLLPYWVAAGLWTVVLVGCLVGALWLMGVRDWRCYLVALLSEPFLSNLGLGNPTPIVIFLVAVAYRFRENWVRSALAVGAALAMKPFVLPLLLWRAGRRSLLAGAFAAALMLAGWSVIDFRGLRGYPHLLGRLTDAQGSHGASVYAIAAQLGGSPRLATSIALASAALVLVFGRFSFNAVVLASLLDSPVTWSLYFTLLYLVIARQSPRFSPRWLVGFAYTPFALRLSFERPLWALLLAVGAAVYVCAVPVGSGSAALQRVKATSPSRAQTSAA